MKNNLHRGAYVPNFLLKNVTLSGLLILFVFGLLSCSSDNKDNSHLANQRHLIAELQKHQLIWNNAGITDYTLSLQKQCTTCPEELQSQQVITVRSNSNKANANPVAKSNVLSRAITARDDDDNERNQNQQNVSVETLFTDLRQAIAQNQVQQITFDPEYGFPQTVLVNSANFQPTNVQQINTNDFDDDDRNFVPNLSIQTNGFQVLGRNNVPQTISLNGQFIRQPNPVNNANNQFWLVDNNGQWNQLNVPASVFPTVNSLNNQAYVQASGQWIPGGINGQGLINLQQISPNQTIPIQNNLSGTLFYSVLNNDSFDLDDFYVTDDRGGNVFLNLPNNLQNQAFQLAGQRVNLSGNWTPFLNAPNARFIPSGINAVNTVLEQFSGILTQASTFQVPGQQQSNYLLIDDFGSVLELQIPAILSNNISYLVGQRVTVHGTRINAGAFGQQIIYAQGISQQQNVFTDTQISGIVEAVLPTDFTNTVERVILRLDTGGTVTLRVPSTFRDPFNPLTTGMRVQASGAWISNTTFGQGEFDVRAPLQITSFGTTVNNTYSGFISNVGSISTGTNCNAQQTVYGFTTDSGQQLQLFVSNSTFISGLANQGANLPFQTRIQVTGSMLSPGVLQAQTITVTPQFETTITGTIIEIGAAGSTFTCTGTLNTYRLLDSFGNAYSITTSPNSVVQGSLGSFLRIGDVVQVTGSRATDGTTFHASQIIATPGSFGSSPVNQSPIFGNSTTVVGTVTGLNCSNGFSETYNFVDQTGSLFAVTIDQNIQAGLFIDVGTQLQITGTVMNDEITAQQVTAIQTFADPINRIPINGTIMSSSGTQLNYCNMPVYIYQFQNDNGQIQQLRLTMEAALHLPQPIVNGTRISVVASVQSFNTQVIDALEIEYRNGIGGTGSFGSGFGTGNNGLTTTSTGTIVATSCNNEYYFVDNNGTGFQLQLNAALLGFNPTVGTRLNVVGQRLGNQLIASSTFFDTSNSFLPIVPIPAYGTINSLINTETLNCGITINTYSFQNDNGLTQRLRVASSNTPFLGQTLTIGSRVVISDKVESFDGTVIDALSISQQSFF